MAKNFTVFTYGSLMKGFYGNKKLLKNTEFLGTATINGTMRYTGSDYPVVIMNKNGDKNISGELYKVNKNTMNELRKYEGIGSLLTCYTERVVKAKTDKGDIDARAFVVAPSIALPVRLISRPVSNGNWREFTTSKQRRPIKGTLLLFASVAILTEIIWQMGLI